MLSRQEQRVWDDVQRFWAEEVEEPPRAASPAPSPRKRASRDVADLPAAVVAGAWSTIMLVLFGAPVAGLAIGVATALGWGVAQLTAGEQAERTGQLAEQRQGKDHARAGGQALAPAPTAHVGRRLTNAEPGLAGVDVGAGAGVQPRGGIESDRGQCLPWWSASRWSRGSATTVWSPGRMGLWSGRWIESADAASAKRAQVGSACPRTAREGEG